VADAPRYWRAYRGCRCYDERTGEMKAGKRICTCPVGVIVGNRRAKLMAREEAKRGR